MGGGHLGSLLGHHFNFENVILCRPYDILKQERGYYERGECIFSDFDYISKKERNTISDVNNLII